MSFRFGIRGQGKEFSMARLKEASLVLALTIFLLPVVVFLIPVCVALGMIGLLSDAAEDL